MGIDLNTVEEDGEAAAVGVCGELWHACAGPGVALPRRGSAVVYLPQAHLAAGGGEAPAGAPPVPPHVACRVVGVELCVSPLAILASGHSDSTSETKSPDQWRAFCGAFAGGCGDGRGVRAPRAGGGRRGQCSCFNTVSYCQSPPFPFGDLGCSMSVASSPVPYAFVSSDCRG